MRTCANLSLQQIEDLRYPDAVAVLLLPSISTTSSPTPSIPLLDSLLIGVTLSPSSDHTCPTTACPGKSAQKTTVSRLVLPLHLGLTTVQGLGGEVEEVLEVDSAEVHGGD